MHACMHAYGHTRLRVCVYIHTYIHTYIHACIHTHPHTQTHTHIHTLRKGRHLQHDPRHPFAKILSTLHTEKHSHTLTFQNLCQARGSQWHTGRSRARTLRRPAAPTSRTRQTRGCGLPLCWRLWTVWTACAAAATRPSWRSSGMPVLVGLFCHISRSLLPYYRSLLTLLHTYIPQVCQSY